MPSHIFSLHRHAVNPRILIAVTDGLSSHRKVHIYRLKAVSKIYLVFGTQYITLKGKYIKNILNGQNQNRQDTCL